MGIDSDIVSASFVVNPSIYKKLPYDTLKDFIPITNVCAQEAFILTVHPSVPAQTVQELVALGRKPESKLSYGSPGVGNTMHLAGALFDARAHTNMAHIPYKGGGPAIAALLGGEIQAMFANTTLALPHIKAGKLRALGVTGRTRLAALPDVPTLTESGVPRISSGSCCFFSGSFVHRAKSGAASTCRARNHPPFFMLSTAATRLISGLAPAGRRSSGPHTESPRPGNRFE